MKDPPSFILFVPPYPVRLLCHPQVPLCQSPYLTLNVLCMLHWAHAMTTPHPSQDSPPFIGAHSTTIRRLARNRIGEAISSRSVPLSACLRLADAGCLNAGDLVELDQASFTRQYRASSLAPGQGPSRWSPREGLEIWPRVGKVGSLLVCESTGSCR